MVIRRKWLLINLGAAAALFVIAAPLGDNHHGLGRHNAFFATVGQGLFLMFLASVVVLIVATIVASVQAIVAKTNARKELAR